MEDIISRKFTIKGKNTSIFWRILILFVVLGTFIPAFCQPCFRGDVLEQIVTGRHYVCGTWKHPTMSTWIMQFFWSSTFKAPFAPYLASMACIGVTMMAIRRLLQDYLPDTIALWSTLVLTAYWYFNMGSAMYNNNVPLTMFWYLAILFFHFALTTNRKRWWLLLGLSLGCGMLCKYVLVFLLATMVVYMTARSKTRWLWLTAGPWLTGLAVLLVFYPHLCFYLEHRLAMATYTGSKAVSLAQFPLQFLSGWATQIGIISPLLIAVGLIIAFRKQDRVTVPFPRGKGVGRSFLLAMFLLPIAFQSIGQCVSLIPFTQRSYGFPLWPLLPACLIYYLPIMENNKAWQRATCFVIIAAVLQMVSLPVQCTNIYLSSKANVRFYPALKMSHEIDRLWSIEFANDCPWSCGDTWEKYYYATYSAFQPKMDCRDYAFWNTDEQIRQSGGVLLWNATNEPESEVPKRWKEHFPKAQYVTTIEHPYLQRSSDIPPAKMGVAFIPPEKNP